ncbi:hypothetical protein [Haloprofundus salilacus]|uniref:hypothetical protein n=1 Tax=Haloprofundus salilacus TaxID=2876190 RepID=UPI001CC9ED63|nr:hypothetical protein [Haloprofundus salilacus]
MFTKSPNAQERTGNALPVDTTTGIRDDHTQFVDLSSPEWLDADSLKEMRLPDDDPTDGEVRVYAVARINGVFQDFEADKESEGACVLYVTADDSHAVEVEYPHTYADEYDGLFREYHVNVNELTKKNPSDAAASVLALHEEDSA